MKAFMFKVSILFLIIYTDAKKFPDNLYMGVATSSYQIEGAWNEDGKGPNIWDNFTHADPTRIIDGSNADIACDSYHKYQEDVAIIADVGLNMYRFSISWPRILPQGYANGTINQLGIQYYQNVVQELKQKNISAGVTLYHWDLPQKLFEDGVDWTNPQLVDIFVDYARIVIQSLPEVDVWFTINEPKQVCRYGYGVGLLAPGVVSSGQLEYQCAYVLLKAHAAVYHMYKEEFPQYNASMTIAPDAHWVVPVTNSSEDIAAADRRMQFEHGLYFHPVFVGDWPEVVKNRVAYRSLYEGRNQSRLPIFTEEEINYINGTADFIAFNHYLTLLVTNRAEAAANVTSYENDLRMSTSYYPSEEVATNGFTLNPWGIRKMINWIKEHYGDYEIVISEVGMSENGTSLEDDTRINFYTGLYCNILDAVDDGANVVGIINWSIMDNFEWVNGYWARFGFYSVNFTDPERPRVPKKSAGFLKEVIRTQEINCNETVPDNGTDNNNGTDDNNGTNNGNSTENTSGGSSTIATCVSLVYILICGSLFMSWI